MTINAAIDFTQTSSGVETRVILGAPDGVVERLANELKARLIVAGTHARWPVGRLLIGSVAQRRPLHAPCPVLVVRDGGAKSLGRWRPSFSRLLREC